LYLFADNLRGAGDQVRKSTLANGQLTQLASSSSSVASQEQVE
jgi:hypothetical protein